MDRSKHSFVRVSEEIKNPAPLPSTDAIDLKLMKLLLEDGRATLKSLAAAVGLSSPAVSERLARLQSVGVIKGYSVDIDWQALGYSMVVYLSILIRPGFDRSTVLEDLGSVPNIEEIAVVTGPSDLILRIRTTGFEHLTSMIAEHIWSRNDLEFTETRVAFYTESTGTFEIDRINTLLAKHAESA
ncbi:Lrp/AsnC family transcriptional regulator [Leucobacter salsicius]|uniref:Lrp/AsnC family transcriptional regulator n=1 Tax=Leucobacter salsicius TaxID=664638 RepID=UPI00034BA97F|nr:AsnC family transcriptional regulator [Leucobacter salsicius]